MESSPPGDALGTAVVSQANANPTTGRFAGLRSGGQWNWVFWAVAAMLFGLKVWLLSAQTRHVIGWSAHDDAHYVKLAGTIGRGRWLGAYDNLTLIKGIGYSAWLAACHLAGIPSRLAEQFAYGAACVLFVVALRPVLSSLVPRITLFTVLLFNPMSYDGWTLRFTRECIYTPETLAVFALAFGILLRFQPGARALWLWTSSLGAVLGLFWITREEGLWIAPSLGIVGLACGARVWSHGFSVMRRSVCMLFLSVPIALLPSLTTASLNSEYYGVFTTCEFTGRSFVAAIGALSRVEHLRDLPRVPVPKETRLRIYEASPAFQELKPFLEGPTGEGWSHVGQPPTDDPTVLQSQEILGGWFVWALRDAARDAGYFKTAEAAAAYFDRLANEVDNACTSSQLRCLPERHTLAPPWRPGYLEPWLKNTFRGIRLLSNMEGFLPVSSWSVATRHELRLFQRVTLDSLTPLQPAANAQSRGAYFLPPDPMHRATLRALFRIGETYSLVLPPALLVSSLLVLVAYAVPRLRVRTHFAVLVAALWAAIIARASILAYIDMTLTDAIHPGYLQPAYPLVLGVCFISAWDGAAAILTMRNSSRGARRETVSTSSSNA